METRSNYVIVGIVTFILIGLLIGFTVWLSRFSDGATKEYDIYFRSVSGLNTGSSVGYSGVNIGKVVKVGLWRNDPEFVRVRIAVSQSTPILEGTVATISGVGFTGVSELQLSGGLRGSAEIKCPAENPESACPDGVPIIPTKPGALGELLNNAPLLVERLATLAERLTNVLSDDNQKSISNIFSNVDRLSGGLANQTPDIRATLKQSQKTLSQAEKTLARISVFTEDTSSFIDSNGSAVVKDLNETLKTARNSLQTLEATVTKVNPAIDNLNNETLPEANKLLRDLQELSSSLELSLIHI